MATVHTVMYHDPRNSGPAADYHHLARFRTLRDAKAFAAGRTCHGNPATVDTDRDVPQRLADRWSYVTVMPAATQANCNASTGC